MEESTSRNESPNHYTLLLRKIWKASKPDSNGGKIRCPDPMSAQWCETQICRYVDKPRFCYMAYVPLDMIPYRRWNDRRYALNYERISKQGTVSPIHLDKPPGSKRTSLLLIDGNHRCAVCRDLGYTHILAILHIKVPKSDRFILVPRPSDVV